MNVKKYADGTYNIIYETGDYVKVKEKTKYSDDVSKNANKWGEIVKIIGKPITAKLTINIGDGEIDEYVFNVKPVNENGEELTEEQILQNTQITEEIKRDYKNIIKFNDFV